MDPIADILVSLEAATREPASALQFTPVRLRARRDGWTPQRQHRYIAALALTGRSGHAAALVGVTEQSAARLARRPDGASFAAARCAASSFASKLRRARPAAAAAAAAMPMAESSVRPEDLSPKGSALSTRTAPSGPRR